MSGAVIDPHPADSGPIGDRAGDRRLIADGRLKPPAPRRATVRAACLITLGLVLFGTLGPVSEPGTRAYAWPQRFDWRPAIQPTDANDLLTNLIVYLPVGVSLRLLVRRRGGAGWVDYALTCVLAAGLSAVTEILQQCMPARSSNAVDIVVNTLGAAAGAALAPSLQWRLRAAHARLFIALRRNPERTMAILVLSAVAALMTAPWRPHAPNWAFEWDRPWEWMDFRRLGAFALVGFFVTTATLGFQAGRWVGVITGVMLSCVFVVFVEMAQSGLAGHSASASDVRVQWAGAGLGALLAWRRATQSRAPAAQALAGLLAAGLAVIALGAQWPVVAPTAPAIRFVPFEAEFAAPFRSASLAICEQTLLFLLLTQGCLALSPGRKAGWALALLLSGAVLAELVHALLGGGAARSTSLALAFLGWFFGVRLWSALFPPELAEPHSAEAAPAPTH